MEKFCLPWNDFEKKIRNSFKELREAENQFDVTLACEDNQQIKAHKIILSAGSDFFRQVLKQTNHSSPFIYLKGIRIVELENIVEFLYNGEAHVAHEELNKFLKTGKELQVKGLQNNLGDGYGKIETLETKYKNGEISALDKKKHEQIRSEESEIEITNSEK